MPTKTRRKKSEPVRAADKKVAQKRDKGWDQRLRSVGDARFVEVQWSGKDDPSWPLPRK